MTATAPSTTRSTWPDAVEDHGWAGALLGTGWGRPDTFTVADGARRAHHDVRAADRDPARLLAPGALRLRRRHPRPAHRRPGAGQHRLRPGQPAAYGDVEGDQAPALRAHQGVHAARPPAVDRGERHLQRRALLRRGVDRVTPTGRARRPDPPAALLRRRLRGGRAGLGDRGRRAAVLGRAARRRRRADRAAAGARAEPGARPAAARVRAADHHAGARHHRGGLARRRGEGREDGRAGRGRHLPAEVPAQRLRPSASSGCSTWPSAATCSTTTSTPRPASTAAAAPAPPGWSARPRTSPHALRKYQELGITHFVLSDTPYKTEIAPGRRPAAAAAARRALVAQSA